MSYFAEVGLGTAFAPYRALEARYRLLPGIFRAQSLLPRAIEAEAGLVLAVLGEAGVLPRIAREEIVLAVAAACGEPYWVALEWHVLRGLGVAESELERFTAGRHTGIAAPRESALIDFALKLACRPDCVGKADIDSLRGYGWEDPEILEAAVTTALARALCLLAGGTGVQPDGESKPIPARPPYFPAEGPVVGEEPPGPYLVLPPGRPPALDYFQETFGLVPNLIAAQAGRTDLLDAQTGLIKAVLVPGDILSRLQKECIFIAVAAANLSTYCVAAHCQILRGLGVPPADADQIAVNHRLAPLSEADKGLLDFTLALLRRPRGTGAGEIARLRDLGFSPAQILEAVAMTALTTFFNTLSLALGEVPDFPPPRVFRPQEVHRFPFAARPVIEAGMPRPADPDAELVARVQTGETDAFEELVRRHTRRIYRTLVGVLGDADEARDAMQETFLKAYQNIGGFQGRSKFITWLISIATHAGIERLRERRPAESLDETGEDRLLTVQARTWRDNPEEAYSRGEIRAIVERGVMRLPAPYRLAVMLRDIEQLSNEEAAAALNLSVPGFKARVFRGRCLLRETLAPHFTWREKGAGR